MKRGLDRTSEIMLNVAVFTCLLLPVIVLAIVVVRAVVPGGMPVWSIDVCQLLLWLVIYLGAGMAFRLGRHVRVSVFIDRLQGRVRRAVDFVTLVVSLGVGAMMLAGGLNACIMSWLQLRKTYSEVPEYLFAVAIPVGLMCMVYEAVMCVREQTSSVFGRKV